AAAVVTGDQVRRAGGLGWARGNEDIGAPRGRPFVAGRVADVSNHGGKAVWERGGCDAPAAVSVGNASADPFVVGERTVIITVDVERDSGIGLGGADKGGRGVTGKGIAVADAQVGAGVQADAPGILIDSGVHPYLTYAGGDGGIAGGVRGARSKSMNA